MHVYATPVLQAAARMTCCTLAYMYSVLRRRLTVTKLDRSPPCFSWLTQNHPLRLTLRAVIRL